jgi:hypothetical protein
MAPPSLVRDLPFETRWPTTAVHVHHLTNTGNISGYLSKPAELEVQLELAGKIYLAENDRRD